MKYRRALYRTLLVIVWIAILAYLWRYSKQFLSYDFVPAGHNVLVSVGLIMGGIISNLLAWILLANGFGISASILHGARAWSVSRLGRYVPGKVALLVLRFNAYPGRPRRTITLATIAELFTSIGAAASVVVTGTLILRDTRLEPWLLPIAGLGLLCLSASAPWTLRAVSGWLGSAGPIAVPSSIRTLVVLVLQALAICSHGLSLYFLLNAFEPVATEHMLLIIVAYYGAGLAGVLAVFAPSGIGVREGVLLVLLTPLASIPAVSAAVLLIRILLTLTEIVITGGLIAASSLSEQSQRKLEGGGSALNMACGHLNSSALNAIQASWFESRGYGGSRRGTTPK